MALDLTGARDLALDSDGDLVVSGGDLAIVADGEAIVQAITLAITLFTNEWFLDGALGLPYRESILVKNPNFNAVRELYRQKILSAVGVLSVLSLVLDYNPNTRTLAVTWRVSTALGELSEETPVTI